MNAAEDFLASVDQTNFSLLGTASETPKPWGKEVHLTPSDAPYAFKLIHIHDGARLSLQVHDKKTETWTIYQGEGMVIFEDATGKLTEVILERGKGYTSAIGQKHRLVGITDCIIAEASTPELGTTYRLEDDYARPDETEEVRNSPNRGWNG